MFLVHTCLNPFPPLACPVAQDMAQGVLSLPRPGQRPLQLNNVALTLGTSYRGTLSATVEIVKVRFTTQNINIEQMVRGRVHGCKFVWV